ncbi:DUF1203 domain-containing protein [Solimicrobium silvestre]|uniref:DUF1203 domain-containing protein n=1 Tax=Solimicrobium silvestre TaxID=2099400 RepID=A0A2S9H003_9BURK|nr:DUF1203 domain-containing protein [Solimicrobium silvestre]PRC93297.1 hypothetical protein S2091_2035 [Solimicrobium silvestre]
MSFRILGLAPDQFQPLFSLSDAELEKIGARRLFADEPGMPCRVSMAHAELGEELLLLNFEHQPANTPYRATHAIYVRKLAKHAFTTVDSVPEILATRLLAVRAYNAEHMMIDAEIVEGILVTELFERFFADPQTSYLHVHNARRGCYAGRVERYDGDGSKGKYTN